MNSAISSRSTLAKRPAGSLLSWNPRRAHKNHVIETTFHADYVHADPRRLEQVLTNLIDNAIKYVPQGGKIRVQWQKGDHAVFLRVSDNGPGIPAKDQTRLFERFFRIDKARSREMGGTGLGLAIVKHIMQKHGGNVRVESELGKRHGVHLRISPAAAKH